MNYFDFFDIPFSLTVDEQLLKGKFYSNSKKFHPDFFALDSDESQSIALEQSTINNQAYKTLHNFESRLLHILKEKNIMGEEGQNHIPQDFLMEMMDINEAVMELQFEFEELQFKTLCAQIEKIKADLKETIKHIIPKTGDEILETDFEALKNYYLKSKYLTRLTENINKLKA